MLSDKHTLPTKTNLAVTLARTCFRRVNAVGTSLVKKLATLTCVLTVPDATVVTFYKYR